jgi:hypothetical protein
VGGGAKALATLLRETQAAAALHMAQEMFELGPDEPNGRRSILRCGESAVDGVASHERAIARMRTRMGVHRARKVKQALLPSSTRRATPARLVPGQRAEDRPIDDGV